jgi:hypothetical protein
LSQQVMETSGPATAFKDCKNIIQAAAVEQRSGKQLTRNPVTIFETSDIVDKLNDSGGIDRECMSVDGSSCFRIDFQVVGGRGNSLNPPLAQAKIEVNIFCAGEWLRMFFCLQRESGIGRLYLIWEPVSKCSVLKPAFNFYLEELRILIVALFF